MRRRRSMRRKKRRRKRRSKLVGVWVSVRIYGVSYMAAIMSKPTYPKIPLYLSYL